jgi:hypothetical protein
MSYRSLGSDEVTLRNYRPVGRRKGNMSLSDPLAAGVVVDLHKCDRECRFCWQELRSCCLPLVSKVMLRSPRAKPLKDQ